MTKRICLRIEVLLLRMSSSQDDKGYLRMRSCYSGRVAVRMTQDTSGWSHCCSGWVASQDGRRMHHRMWLSGCLHGSKKVTSKDYLLRRMLKRMSRWIGKGLQGWDKTMPYRRRLGQPRLSEGWLMSPFYFFRFPQNHRSFVIIFSSLSTWSLMLFLLGLSWNRRCLLATAACWLPRAS